MKLYHLTLCCLFNTEPLILQSDSIALYQWEYIDLDYLLYETTSVKHAETLIKDNSVDHLFNVIPNPCTHQL